MRNLRNYLFTIIVLSFHISVFAQSSTSSLIFVADWNHDSTLFAISRTDGSIEIRSVDGEVISTVLELYGDEYTFITSLDWHPEIANVFATADRNGNVFIMKYEDEAIQIEMRLNLDLSNVDKVRWNADGKYLAIMGGTGTGDFQFVEIWDNNTGVFLNHLIACCSVLTDISWNPQDANQILVADVDNEYGGQIRLWDVSTDTIIMEWSELSGPLEISWNVNGTMFAMIYIGAYDNPVVTLHDASTGDVIQELPSDLRNYQEIIWLPDNILAIYGFRSAYTIELWDLDTLLLVQSIELDEYITFMVWNNADALFYGQYSIERLPITSE